MQDAFAIKRPLGEQWVVGIAMKLAVCRHEILLTQSNSSSTH
jgi:hypothetical protein